MNKQVLTSYDDACDTDQDFVHASGLLFMSFQEGYGIISNEDIKSDRQI